MRRSELPLNEHHERQVLPFHCHDCPLASELSCRSGSAESR
jgi:hypothetical protein